MFLATESTHRMLIRHEPDIGHLYVPNQVARIPSPHGGFYFRSNSLGFRSDREYVASFSATGPGRRPRILFLGDSFTAGDGVDNAQRFSDRIGELLGAEVYNYGLSGSGTDQQLLIFEKFARDVEADLVVLCLQVENMDRIQLGFRPAIDRVSRQNVLVPKPYFTLADGVLQRHHDPVPRERPAAARAGATVPSGGGPGHRGLRAKVIDRYLRDPRLAKLRAWSRKHLKGVRSLVLRQTRFDPYPDYARDDTPGFQLMRAIVQRLHGAMAGRPLLIVPLPNAYYLTHGLRPTFQSRLAALARPAAGLHVGDVTTSLLRQPLAERKRMQLHDGHYSSHGHAVVAEQMVREIRRLGLTPTPRPTPPPTPSVRTRQRPTGTWVLGLSCLYHNSAAALVQDGRLVAAAEEERFTRVKNDRRLPAQAINFCLEQAGLQPEDLAAVVYYDNAYLTFERLLHTLAASGARSEDAWSRVLPSWLEFKLRIPQLVRKHLHYEGPLLQESHHRSHAASAFLPSPFDRAAILTVDGVGEWATAAIGRGQGKHVELLREMHFPHSLGLLYSAFTQFTGFKVNSGEYKMMGLAPYGEPRYVQDIYDHLLQVHEDGSLRLNLEYFAFLTEPTMTSAKFAELFGGPARQPDGWITRREMDLARSVQVVTEDVLLKMARHAHALTGEKKLAMSGGVTLNCVANGRLLREGPFEDLWIQPAAGDAGSALGAALDVSMNWFDQARPAPTGARPPQRGSCWGPEFSDDEIRAFLDTYGYPYETVSPDIRSQQLASLLAQGKVVGHFAGRMEYGPRALGARSILGDARNEDTQAVLNLKIKYRESFRPFAPVVLAERVSDYFELDRESPYMLLVAPVKKERCLPLGDVTGEDLTAIVRQPRSDLPAITHIDYSARIQTIVRDDLPAYYDVLQAFEQQTGCGVLVNTSFNVRGEPIVCTPFDAYRCFMRTEMDVLALGNQLLVKAAQPPWPEDKGHVEKSEDAPAAETVRTDQKLRVLFHQVFLPALAKLHGDLRCRLEGHAGDSNWQAHQPPASIRAVFEIPAALQATDLDPRAMTTALVGQWQPGPATEALRPVVEALLALARAKPVAQRADEQVPDSVYVMF